MNLLKIVCIIDKMIRNYQGMCSQQPVNCEFTYFLHFQTLHFQTNDKNNLKYVTLKFRASQRDIMHVQCSACIHVIVISDRITAI